MSSGGNPESYCFQAPENKMSLFCGGDPSALFLLPKWNSKIRTQISSDVFSENIFFLIASQGSNEKLVSLSLVL